MVPEVTIPEDAAKFVVGMSLVSISLLKLVHTYCQKDCEKPVCSPDCRLYIIEKKFRDLDAKTQQPTAQESTNVIIDDQDIILGHNPLKSP